MISARVVSLNARKTVELFSEGLTNWGISLSSGQTKAFALYAEMLVDWNTNRFNLTRLVSPEQIALNHFLDSVVLSQLIKIPASSKMIDIGTGAGFPGLAFKILRPDIQLTLIESTAKKLSFCQTVANELSLTGITYVHGRAEDSVVVRRFETTADIVTARAVAPLKTLLAWTAPLAAPGGNIVAWKGLKVHDEVAEARSQSEHFRLKMEIVEKILTIPGLLPVKHFYVIAKSAPSPK